MMDSPFKPPRRPAGAGGAHAPIPPVPVPARRHGAIPNAQVQMPRRPSPDDDDDNDKTIPTDRWAFAYRGNAGSVDIESGTDEIPFKPPVELPEAHPLTVLFQQDTQTLQTSNIPTSQNWNAFTFDAVQGDEGLAADRFRFSEEDTDQPYSSLLYIADHDGELSAFLRRNVSPTVHITYGSSYIDLAVTAWELRNDVVDYLQLTVSHLDSLINDGPLEDAQPVSFELRGMRVPNAAVRARVRYRNGKSEAQFDCDWAGGFQVLADRLELSRVIFAPDTDLPYTDAAVDISATVIADAPRPGGSLSLTIPPVAVPSPSGVRYAEFPIHPFGRRVNLLLKYGNDPDAPGDVPLGQIFLAFVGKFGRSLCYIDAMAAREALFGAGLPIPSGVSKLVVSNRSDDDTMQIGVLWRLEL